MKKLYICLEIPGEIGNEFLLAVPAKGGYTERKEYTLQRLVKALQKRGELRLSLRFYEEEEDEDIEE